MKRFRPPFGPGIVSDGNLGNSMPLGFSAGGLSAGLGFSAGGFSAGGLSAGGEGFDGSAGLGFSAAGAAGDPGLSPAAPAAG
jgi:hypothetical protein